MSVASVPLASGQARAPAFDHYPTHLIDVFHTPRGRRLTLRPALAQDAQALAQFYQGLTRDTLRRRFHCAFSGLSAGRVRELSDLSRVDHARLLVLVATVTLADGQEQVVAQAGWQQVEADGVAEFALVVADAWQSQGLGLRLVRALVQGAARREMKWLKASVLEGNEGMLALMRRCGFWLATQCDEEGTFDVLGHVPRLAAQGLPGLAEHRPPWWQRLVRRASWARRARRTDRGQA